MGMLENYLTQVFMELSRTLFLPPIYALVNYQLRKLILIQVVLHYF